MDDQNNNIVFPEQTVSILTSILEKYKINETDQEILKKSMTNQFSTVAFVTGLVKKVAVKEIDFEGMVSSLKEKLELPAEEIEKMAKELQDDVISLAKPKRKSKQSLKSLSQPKMGRRDDTYREPVE